MDDNNKAIEIGKYIEDCDILLREIEDKKRLLMWFEQVETKFANRYPNGKETDFMPFEGRCAVYTVITGGYDELTEPTVVNSEWDYYMFTDTPEKYASSVWEIRDIREIEMPNVGNATFRQRYIKTHPHIVLSDYDYTIYVDGKFQIKADISLYVEKHHGKCTMLAFPHYCNESITDEAGDIIKYGKGDPITLMRQINAYKAEGYPLKEDDRPLIDSGVLVRSNRDPLLIKVMEDWWNEILNKSHRDQMSIGYVSWKNHYVYDICNLIIYRNDYFNTFAHL